MLYNGSELNDQEEVDIKDATGRNTPIRVSGKSFIQCEAKQGFDEKNSIYQICSMNESLRRIRGISGTFHSLTTRYTFFSQTLFSMHCL